MTIQELILDLKKKGIDLFVEAGKLRFRAEKGAMTAEIKQIIVGRKADIIATLEKVQGMVSTTRQEAPQPAPADAPKPLSFAQERLWFLDQLEGEQPIFLIPRVWRIEGEVYADHLQKALDLIIARHESLRTTFINEDGKGKPLVHPHLAYTMERHDLSSLANDEQSGSLVALSHQLLRDPFDLTRLPLFRLALIKRSQKQHLLVLCIHHIIFDGWSVGIFSEELCRNYDALARGEQVEVKPLELQYTDYAHWERGRMTPEALEGQLSYWREQLNAVPLVEFPADHLRPTRQTYDGANIDFQLSPDTYRALMQLARRYDASLYMVLLTGLQILLQRYSGQDDITVGSSIGNRKFSSLEPIIGMFVNLLAMRGDLRGDPSVAVLLERIKHTALDAFKHQDVPFEKVVEACGVSRDLSRHPLFQIQLVLINLPEGSSAGLNLEPTELAENVVARQDLTVYFQDVGGALHGTVEYNVDLFEAPRMQRMIGHLQTLFAALSVDPDQPISRLAMLTPSEKIWIEERHQTEQTLPSQAGLHHLFEAQVATRGEAVAVQQDSDKMTFATLESKANQLARHLRERGVTQDTLVGVCLSQGFPLVTTILAIIKAGAAYVPLNPDYPQERLSFLLSDTGMSVLVTEDDLLDVLPAMELNFIDTLVLDEAMDDIQQQDTTPLDIPCDDDLLAYVVYTSGTTGRPKGVQVTHANVKRLICDTNYVQPRPGDGFAQVSNVSFDALTFEFWTSLCHGGRLCLIDKQSFVNPEHLEERLAEEQVDNLFITTALFNQIARSRPGLFGRLRHLLFGGEQVDPRSVRAVLEHGRPGKLLHVYGPTESTTYASWYEVSTLAEDARNLSIGGPIANTTLHVLDRHGNEQPEGVVGEVFIGGKGLARGYLNRPALTAERFLPNTFANAPGQRLYKTGDLMKRDAEGGINFYGRRDQQVKLRGFRIELEEIEVALCEHGSVREAVVVLCRNETDPTHKFLAGYVVADGEVTTAELRDYLGGRLPDYMVPASFVVMDRFPLNANGKVDRRALPDPTEAVAEQQTYTAPRNEAEETLARIWQEVLGRPQVGIHDNFFELGGDSLLSVQVKAQANKQGLDFSLHHLFEYPTIADLLAHNPQETLEKIEIPEPFALISEADRQRLPEGVVDAYPLSRLQLGMVYHNDMDADEVRYHDVITYRIQLAYNHEAMVKALAWLAKRHPMYRTGFALEGFDQPLQLVYENVSIPLKMFDLHRDADAEEQLLDWLEREKHGHFDLSRAPILDVVVHLLSDGFQLGLSFHHAILDGWSEAHSFTELMHAYTAYLREEEPAVRPLPPPYSAYIKLEQDTLQAEESVTYWRNWAADHRYVPLELEGGDSSLTDQQKVLFMEIDDTRSMKLQSLANDMGVPIKAVLLAAHCKAMAVLSGRRAPITGVVTPGRPELDEAEHTLGLFLNSLPLSIDTSSGSWRDLIQAAFRQEKAHLPHRRYPLPEIVGLCDGKRPFDTLFNFTHFHAYDALQDQRDNLVKERGGFAKSSFPLVCNFQLTVGDRQIVGMLDYDPAAVSLEQVEMVRGVYERILQSIAEHPEAGQANRHYLSDTQLQRYQALNHDDEQVTEANLDAMVARVARQQPDHPAVIGTKTLSYGELWENACKIANLLRGNGVGIDSFVGLSLVPGIDVPQTVLGVALAGAAYMPLDSELPAQRLRFMIADASLKVIVVHRRFAECFSDFQGRLLIYEEMDWSNQAATPPEVKVDLDNLIYMNYTSGTTGVPKGVMITHRGVLCRQLDACTEFKPDDVLTLAANMAFDGFTAELWPALCHGATLAIADRDTMVDSQALHRFIETHGVTNIFFTTGLFHQHAHARPEMFKGLRYLRMGGQRAEAPAFYKVARQAEPEHILNMYGPTEITEHCIWHDATLADCIEGELPVHVPIGQPNNFTGIYLLDQNMQPVLPGGCGEIYVSGQGLARGYLGRPSLTAERFVPNPFGENGSRLYRTGDLAFLNAQDRYVYQGRIDDQVKIRGFRIEPGEIERALASLEEVGQAVVTVVQQGEDQLLAAYITEGTCTAEPAEIRQKLAETLPAYMVPGSITVLPAIPLTSNGKVDFRALPEPEMGAETAIEPARDEVEQGVLKVFHQLFGKETIGINHDFFMLGGHSLLVVRCMAQIKEHFHVDLPLKTLTERPTPARLAEAIKLALHVSRADEWDDDEDDEDGTI